MADQATIDEITDYYCNLLIVQYNNLPNAQATIALFVEQFLASGISFDVRDGYDLETAIGMQLDVLAKYIGADRFFAAQVLNDFFSFILYDDSGETYTSEVGFCDYTDFGEKPGSWLTYNDIVSGTYSLADADFRTLLKLKILQNNSNHSDKEIIEGVWALFGELLIPQDNYDMTMNYIVDTSISAIINIAYEKGILPKPMGVELILLQSSA